MSDGYCSWCYNQANPTVVDGRLLKRDLLQCSCCGRSIAKCRACNNYAKRGDVEVRENGKQKRKSLRHHFCAEHQHAIPNFETANATLTDPSEYLTVYKYARKNLSRISRVGGITLASAAVLGPLAFFVAPAIGGALGVAMGYSGAVATNVGLATLGGGALAAGGAGMAGGAVVITAVGTSLGGALGAFIGSAYLSSTKGFAISKIRDGKQPALVTISGFLSQRDEGSIRWQGIADTQFKGRAWYHVDWEAKNLADLGKYVSVHSSAATLSTVLGNAASSASRVASKAIGPAATVYQILHVSKNPWHVALVKSEQTGVLLADIIRRCEKNRFVLVGHSLGCRIVASCLQALSTTGYKGIRQVHLLGGAVDNKADMWREAAKAVSGPIVNYTSENDGVLRTLYKVGTFFSSRPIGIHGIDIDKVRNVDVSAYVRRHMQFKTNAAKFLLATS